MGMRTLVVVAALVVAPAAACNFSGTFDSSGLRVRLEGDITRGPTQPVCSVDQPCTAPFVGQFLVRQGALTITSFQTDSAGRFSVQLAPGTYTVVPVGGTFPATQQQTVTVGTDSVTVVHLDYDTGIR
jgi:hypothetical protein